MAWLSLTADHGGVCSVLASTIVAVVQRGDSTTEVIFAGGNSVVVTDAASSVLTMLGKSGVDVTVVADMPVAPAPVVTVEPAVTITNEGVGFDTAPAVSFDEPTSA